MRMSAGAGGLEERSGVSLDLICWRLLSIQSKIDKSRISMVVQN